MLYQDASNGNGQTVYARIWNPRRTRWTLVEEHALLAGIAMYAMIHCTTLTCIHVCGWMLFLCVCVCVCQLIYLYINP
jgi:hypothetical protein